jgi:hypothetical protein
MLKPLELRKPVPMRPPGYFKDCYDENTVKESNRLAAASLLDATRRYVGKLSGPGDLSTNKARMKGHGASRSR